MSRRGFTLAELLVTTGMLAMLAGAGFAAFNAGTRSAIKARRYQKMIARGQGVIQIMANDIREAIAQDEVYMTALDADYEGLDADTVDFLVVRRAKANSQEKTGGLCEVGYYIDNDPSTEMRWLIRREDYSPDDDPLEGGAVSVVGPFVSEMNLQFYDGLVWKSSWENQLALPEAVQIQMVVMDEDEVEEPMLFSTTVWPMAR